MVSAELSPRREKAPVAVYGSLLACDGQRPAPKGHRIIKNLHVLHLAEPNDWTDPLPTGRPNEWIRMLTKTLLIE